jgi:dTDP-4-amino-4,6-dideoxygalactose transaminase
MAIKTFSSTIRRKEMDAVLTCMVEEKVGPGELNERLIQSVKEKFNVAGAVAVRSPSIALKYALSSLNLEKNTGVMVSALAPDWQYIALVEMGYNPIVIDVFSETGMVCNDTIQKGIEQGGRVLILSETMGQIPDIEAILELGIPVIEDISHNAGAILNNKMLGTFGVFSILGLESNDIITAGGGALLIAPQNRDWSVLRKIIESAPLTDILPDINSALAYIQLKESNRNEIIKKEIYEVYLRSLLQGRHKTFKIAPENGVPVVYSFPVLLSSGFKDVKQYALKKDIEIELAFEHSIVSKFPEKCENCLNANSIYLRCAIFPLYPMLGSVKSGKIAKVLATLP